MSHVNYCAGAIVPAHAGGCGRGGKSRDLPARGRLATRLRCLMISAALVGSLPALAHAEWYVVVASYPALDQAESNAAALAERLGLPIALLRDPQGRHHRLVAGPYPDRDAARAARDRIRGEIADAWLLATAATSGAPTNPAPAPLVEPAESAGSTESTESAAEYLSLPRAIATALAKNPSVRAGIQGLEAGAAQVRQALAPLLPQVSLAMEASQIDADRAAASNGRAPEFFQAASLGLSQVLYSEDERSRLAIERIRQKAREQAQQGVVSDTILAAALAYLDVLRADALRQIREDDLALAQSNYERAQIRLELGVAARSEVYRWETNRARRRTELANAEARLAQARIELNRVMDQPLDTPVELKPIDHHDPGLLVSHERIQQALADPELQPRLRRFFLDEAATHSPDLERLREERAAQQRALQGARRSLLIPSLIASADARQETGRGGAGAGILDIDFAKIFPNVPAGNSQIGGDTDKLEWRLALRAELPLYQGGRRFAEIDRLTAETRRVQMEYDATLARVRSNIMSSAASAEARFANIGYARTAAEAARNNLDLVVVSYERGVVTIIDLLDAQNARTQSELAATNAVYDFLADYFRLQRGTGEFDIVETDAERAERLARLIKAL